MKKFTPAMLRNALRMFRGLMKKAKQYLKDPKTLNHLLAEALSRASTRGVSSGKTYTYWFVLSRHGRMVYIKEYQSDSSGHRGDYSLFC